MSKTMPKLGSALDKQSWQWLQDADEDIAQAVAAEVQSGASPEAIRRFVLTHAGADRTGLAARCMSAAGWRFIRFSGSEVYNNAEACVRQAYEFWQSISRERPTEA